MTDLDPVLAQIATAVAAGPGAFDGTPDEARGRLAAAITGAPDEASKAAAGTPVNRAITHDGLEVGIRVTPPKYGTPGVIVVFLHGGGYVLGSAELSDDISQRLVVEL